MKIRLAFDLRVYLKRCPFNSYSSSASWKLVASRKKKVIIEFLPESAFSCILFFLFLILLSAHSVPAIGEFLGSDQYELCLAKSVSSRTQGGNLKATNLKDVNRERHAQELRSTVLGISHQGLRKFNWDRS